MIDDERIEHLLRARPATDTRYEPSIAELLDGRRGEAPVSGMLRWRQGDPALARLLPLVLIVGAILVAATAMFVGGSRSDRLVVVRPTVAPAVTPEPIVIFPVEDLAALLTQFATSHWADTPNVIVDVAIQRDKFWTAASGANYSGGTAVRLGAASHLFIASVALALVDEGRLDLDAPVDRYVTDWPGGDAITIRNLLDGSSGVATFGDPIEDLARLVAEEPERVWTAADAIRIARDRPPRFVAGARHDLADTEDVLLASIVERVTGLPFDEFAYKVFAPLVPPPAGMPPIPYDPTWKLLAIDGGLWDPTGTGTLTEVPDLPPDVLAVLGPGRDLADPVGIVARMTTDVHVHPLLPAATRTMFDRTFEDGGYGGVAMCPCTSDAKMGVGLVGHTGPYTALTVYVPSERLTIAIVANAAVSDDDLQGLLQEIHDLVWPAIR